MATTCPHATYDPLGPQTAARMSSHDLVVLHTMAGPFDVVDDMFHANGFKGTESHFGVRGDGFAKQWQDLDFRADANNDGNHRCISIETADMGEHFGPWGGSDVPAWTDAQLDKIVRIVRWLCDRYDIPPVLVPDSKPGRRGIAYHRQGIPGNFPPPYTGLVPGGELWTVLPGGRGKPCPGDRRITQLIEIVIPRVQGKEVEDDVALTKAQADALGRIDEIDTRTAAIYKLLSDDGTNGRRLKEVTLAVRALLARDGDADEAEIVRLLVPQLLAGLPLEEMAALFAEAVPAEQAEAAAQAVLDALAVRIAN